MEVEEERCTESDGRGLMSVLLTKVELDAEGDDSRCEALGGGMAS